MPDMDLSKHVGQQPVAIHADEVCRTAAFFQRVEQALVDFRLVELVDLGRRQQGIVVEQAVAVGLVQAVRALQAGGELARLLLAVKLHLDHLEVAVLRILAWAHLGHFADGKLQRREDDLLADRVAVLGHIDRALGQLLLDARILATQVLVD